MQGSVQFLVSHSYKDGDEFVGRLKAALAEHIVNEAMVSFWAPRVDMRMGHEWLGQMLSEASRSHAVLFVMTKDSVREDSACRVECIGIQQAGYAVIPVRASKKVRTYPSFVPPEVAYIDCSESAFRDGVGKLAKETALLSEKGPIRRPPVDPSYWSSGDPPGPLPGVLVGTWEVVIKSRSITVPTALRLQPNGQWYSQPIGKLMRSFKDGGSWGYRAEDATLGTYSGNTKRHSTWKVDGWYGPNAFGGIIPDGSRFRAWRML